MNLLKDCQLPSPPMDGLSVSQVAQFCSHSFIVAHVQRHKDQSQEGQQERGGFWYQCPACSDGVEKKSTSTTFRTTGPCIEKIRPFVVIGRTSNGSDVGRKGQIRTAQVRTAQVHEIQVSE